ncbi:MAG: LuxR C-terminal-related transcriptional regulator [Acidimicrobiales bacterium]
MAIAREHRRRGLALSRQKRGARPSPRLPLRSARLECVHHRTRRRGQVADRARSPGRASKEIAERLYLSTRTVESHLHHVYVKLGTLSPC